MDIEIFQKDLKQCLMDAKNKNEDIPSFISTISGDSKKIKKILENMNRLIDYKDIMENGGTDKKYVKESDSEYMFSES
tara:strand:- start:195 stop:428 length:234 start_codon:yes stop_codon:yes gene_type:complete